METLVTVKFCPTPYVKPCYLAELRNMTGRMTIISVKHIKKLLFFITWLFACFCQHSEVCIQLKLCSIG